VYNLLLKLLSGGRGSHAVVFKGEDMSVGADRARKGQSHAAGASTRLDHHTARCHVKVQRDYTRVQLVYNLGASLIKISVQKLVHMEKKR
jgi:hypothetical protein